MSDNKDHRTAADLPQGSALAVRGFSLVEIIVVLLIFSIILAGVFSAYLAQLKSSTREYRLAETDIDLGIARYIMERDIAMAGYGIAENYTAISINPPLAASATNGSTAGPDTLTLTGTALGTRSRAAQGWAYVSAVDAGGVPTFSAWGDARENVRTDPGGNVAGNDAVILMASSNKQLLVQGGAWLFRYNGSPAQLTTLGGATVTQPAVGTLVYGLQSAGDSTTNIRPYNTVLYSLSGANLPANCANGTFRLMRAETTSSTVPAVGTGDTVLACVLDFKVAFGLDTDSNGKIDLWDNGGGTSAGYTSQTLRKNLKQVRAYILVQSGNYDPTCTYPTASIRVGDSSLGIGRNITLTAAQSHCRWKLMSLNITPRNIR